MKMIQFIKVGSSTNDADDKRYLIAADKISAIESDTSNGNVNVFLKTVAATNDNAVGDKIAITCAGKAEDVGDFIAEAMYGNFQKGAITTLDAATLGGAISAMSLSAV